MELTSTPVKAWFVNMPSALPVWFQFPFLCNPATHLARSCRRVCEGRGNADRGIDEWPLGKMPRLSKKQFWKPEWDMRAPVVFQLCRSVATDAPVANFSEKVCDSLRNRVQIHRWLFAQSWWDKDYLSFNSCYGVPWQYIDPAQNTDVTCRFLPLCDVNFLALHTQDFWEPTKRIVQS